MIKLIMGPMGSGKSEKLLEIIEKKREKNERIVCLKPKEDTRDKNKIKSRNGKSVEAIEISNIKDALEIICDLAQKGIKNFAIDEIQFLKFDMNSVKDIVNFVYNNNVNLFLSGLNQTSEMLAFGTTAYIAMFASEITIINGTCDVCGGKSKRTVCKVKKDSEVMIGNDIYSQTCYACAPILSNKSVL